MVIVCTSSAIMFSGILLSHTPVCIIIPRVFLAFPILSSDLKSLDASLVSVTPRYVALLSTTILSLPPARTFYLIYMMRCFYLALIRTLLHPFWLPLMPTIVAVMRSSCLARWFGCYRRGRIKLAPMFHLCCFCPIGVLLFRYFWCTKT